MTVLGDYELLLPIASGGMATVHVARKASVAGFERLVVIKRVHPHLLARPETYDLILDEARVASAIRHPNVVPVLDVIEVAGELLLVQEYVESVALSTLLEAARQRGQRLPAGVLVRVLLDVLLGLQAAHEARDVQGEPLHVVHRDVSPQNILLAQGGSARLIDFGIAKAAHRLATTESGNIRGKLPYISPEQVNGLALDGRADVFSSAVVLYEALTGELLFKGNDQADTLMKILVASVAPPSAKNPALPAELDAVVLQALARDREERFQSAQSFHDALAAAVPAASVAEVASVVDEFCREDLEHRRQALKVRFSAPPAPRPAAARPSARSPLLFAGLAAALIVAGTVALALSSRAEPQPAAPASAAPVVATAVQAPPPLLAATSAVAPPPAVTSASAPLPRRTAAPRKTNASGLHPNPYATKP